MQSFQSEYGLVSDGVVGQATWNRLNEVLIQTINVLLTDYFSFRIRELMYDAATDLMWDTTINSIDY